MRSVSVLFAFLFFSFIAPAYGQLTHTDSVLAERCLNLLKPENSAEFYKELNNETQRTLTKSGVKRWLELYDNHYGAVQPALYKGVKKVNTNKQSAQMQVVYSNCFENVKGKMYFLLTQDLEDKKPKYQIVNAYFKPQPYDSLDWVNEIAQPSLSLLVNQNLDSLYQTTNLRFRQTVPIERFRLMSKILDDIDRSQSIRQYDHLLAPTPESVSTLCTYICRTKSGRPLLLKLRFVQEGNSWILEYVGYKYFA